MFVWPSIISPKGCVLSNLWWLFSQVYDVVKHGNIPELDQLRREIGLHEYK